MKGRTFNNFTKGYARYLTVGNFNTNGGFAGNGRFDTNACGRQLQGNIISQMNDLADLDTGCRFQFVPRDGRPLAGMKYLGVDIEALQRFLKDYPEARVVRLEQNYRSTATILEAANALIAQNSA